ncbi:amidohydrolase family protein [Rhodococcus sp. NPDC060176]|uniref:amidohydrolase family protein n=1 Tax=Rhodococcus sp. NPDC060176 TaxID=3347062 RepID=UPI00364AAEA9
MSAEGVRIDLLVKGAQLFDGTSFCGPQDVAVSHGQIVAVGQSLSADAAETVDAKGLILSPGWIDLHTHVDVGRTFWGMDPDSLAWATGVTTWVDAGSAGLYAVEELSKRVASLNVHVPLLLHASAIGLAGRAAESENEVHFDIDESVRMARKHSQTIRGIKIRLSDYTTGTLGLGPLDIAVEIATQAELPLMVHIGPGIDVTTVLKSLRPGDIVTHAFTPSLLEELDRGPLLDEFERAYRRGVLLDLGHGSGSFSFAVAELLLARGIVPQSFSSDLHLHSRHGVVGTLNDVVAKIVSLGVDLETALAGVTSRPADALRLPQGRIEIGAPADLALFRQDNESRLMSDSTGALRTIDSTLVNVATYVGGQKLSPVYDDQPPTWIGVSESRRSSLQSHEETIRQLLVRPYPSFASRETDNLKD